MGFAVGSRAARRWSQEAFDTLTEYVHPPRQARRAQRAHVKEGAVSCSSQRLGEGWCRPTCIEHAGSELHHTYTIPPQALVRIEPLGAARHVPSSQHEQLLHLHQAF